ncbi:hypothetical protein H9X85_05540 [Anaerotignum lactatifermentans]|uniref:Uncharacterized protein n=1 Tax=Anaerotignum lactatifermentans TaxID=160404 RepID=A0ABS2G758_9FIRM|nr:hypothetical protein [Anaerotignum lactatifermentans]MBM6829089.1 hypothetical protein [Anaerotignum lactatifermentans]MBM6877304.1 hypothetical protein [Anaerotignum lactatifermentans]MBM6950675.1 hypothetical protein [Anaerotignum lactatifermentans]
MFSEKMKELRESGREILVCLSGSEQAREEWLQKGGTAGHLLSPRQVESWLMTGGAQLPPEVAFSGTLEEFVSLFPKSNAEESKKKVNGFLSGAVVEYTPEGWQYYTCNVVVMGCCMGEYLSIVNRKEI